MKKHLLLITLLMALFVPLAMNGQTSLFSEDFEGGSMPTGWTTDGSGTWSIGSGDYSTSTGAGQGTYNALIKHGTTGAVTKLITPAIDLSSASSAKLSFMHIQRSWSGDIDYLKVYYRTSSSGTWTQLVAYTTAIASWTTESEISLSNLSGTYQLAFEYTDNYGYGVGLDDIKIEGEISSCPMPTNLHIVGEVGPRSVTMGWDAESGITFQYAMIQGHNIDPTNVTTFDGTTTTNEMTWNNLMPDTDYTVVLRKVCGTNDYSAAIALEFHTTVACPAPTLALTANSETAHGATLSWTGSSESYTLQYIDLATATISGYTNGTVTVLSEGFEGGSMPTGWDISDCTSSSYPWKVGTGSGSSSGTSTAATGNYNANYYCSTSSNYARLITPAMNLANATEATLTFNYTNPAWAGGYYALTIYYRVNGGAWQQLDQYTSAQSGWTGKTITLTGLADNYQIAFYATGYNNDYGYGVGIDDIEIVAEMSVPQYVWNEVNNATSPYTFDNLNPAIEYQVRVIGNCGSDGNSEPSNVVSFTTLETCPTPQNLDVTTDGATATATWTGTEGTCNIDINGTVTNNVTSPYSFNVNLSTTYEVMVQANCDGETSSWTEAYSFTTPPCVGGHEIAYTLTDSYGDGWNGASITLIEGCEQTTLTCSSSSASGTLTICDDYFAFIWNTGSYDSECSFTFTEGGTTLFTKPSSLSDGQVLYTIGTQATPKPTSLTAGTPDKREVELSWTENGTATAWQICVNGDENNPVAANSNPYTLTGLTPDTDYTIKVRSSDGTNVSCWTDEITVHTAIACARPTSLAEANITYTTVDLSWTGTNDSYVVQYGTWTQVGTDHITTETLTPYTFDLSDFSGMGTVAIRHYNVTDMFRMNVDDIVVTNANGETVYSQNFESGSIPSNMSNIDLDGDGNEWYITSSNINGSYGVTSASWVSGTALTPDNWLVISDIQLGGAITFKAIGQDPSAVSENFGVFVIADNQFTEAYSGTNTSCQVTGLTEGTPYVWRVKGMCDEDPSVWVSSMFKTKDDLLVFATDGAWDNISNWTDADGNAVSALPTLDNKVRIDAAATVAEGVIATAKSAVLNGGSINIAEGGQLKQGSTVKVTMHKAITGYGTGNEEAADHYYFIATPHSCSYLEENSTFPYVLNLTNGDYDFYAFDPTQELEWINYKNNPNHSEFHTGDNYGLFNKKGYLYANAADQDLTFVGTVSSSLNNTLTDSYTYNSTNTVVWNGWKLVGNPFSCEAYINYVDGENVLDADYYVMNSDGEDIELVSSNVTLAPLTGAFINYSVTGTIQFASEAPAKTNRTGVLNMDLSCGRKSLSQARLRFGEGHNLSRMEFRMNGSKLYIPQDNNDYAVVFTESQGEMPVNFKAEKNGSYTLSVNAENIEFGYLHLIDNMTGADIDLLETPSYSFNATTSDYASRFKLVFAAGNADNGSDFAFFSNGNLIVNGEGTLQVIDMTGRVISTSQINGSSSVNLNAAAGVYVLQLTNGENVKTQKIVVR